MQFFAQNIALLNSSSVESGDLCILNSNMSKISTFIFLLGSWVRLDFVFGGGV